MWIKITLIKIFQGLEKIAIEGTDLTAKEISAVMKLTQKYNQEGWSWKKFLLVFENVWSQDNDSILYSESSFYYLNYKPRKIVKTNIHKVTFQSIFP